MADKRKVSAGTKKMEKLSMNPKTPMTKEHKAVTHWMKENIPTKKTKFLHSHVVDYFTGSKAVDMLMKESPFAGQDKLFDCREKCVEYLDMLLRYKMFHRAKKIAVEKEDKKKTKKKDDGEDSKTDTDADKETGGETGGEETEKGEKKEKKKRKIRLDMHLEQMFVDNSDAFVWLYDPIPWYYWILGGGICMIVIIFCLFPLWPKKIRKGAGWLSWLAVVFLCVVLVVGIIKYILFALLYVFSAKKLRFWILPNLTKDVGFLKSFWPLYDYTYTGEYIGDSTEEEEEGAKKIAHEDSDSNESGKSGFEFVDKNKDD